MREIIQRHNRLNGFTFSIIEFGIIALLVGAFATYYLLHCRVVMAIVTWGITLNCVPVVVFGFRQLMRDRASGKSIGSFLDKKAREQHRRENLHMLRDTMILTVGTILPFLSLTAVLFEFLTVQIMNKRRPRGGDFGNNLVTTLPMRAQSDYNASQTRRLRNRLFFKGKAASPQCIPNVTERQTREVQVLARLRRIRLEL